MRMIKLIAILMMVLAQTGVAMNGMIYELSPSALLQNVAVSSVGALVDDNDVVKGNVVFIGKTARGSLLLTHAHLVSKDGVAIPERLHTIRLRFGGAVTSFRTGKLQERVQYNFPTVTKIHLFPGFQASKGASTDSLAIIEIPDQLSEPRHPVDMIKPTESFPTVAPYYTFGFGRQMQEASKEDATLKAEDRDKTTGFLTMAAMKFDGFFQEGLLRFVPLSSEEWKKVHQSSPPQPDEFIDGPCDDDLGSPIFMEANRIETIKKGDQSARLAKARVILIGLHRASAGTCVRNSDKSKPVSAFLDLGKPEYQEWIEKFR